ncbi:MAG: IS1182 family transposase [Phycisphaerae bacterium]
MKRFKAYDTHQSYLLPPSPREWLPADHLAYFIDNVVDQLDLCEVFASYEGTKGQPPYHPEMMVKVWLYGYCIGIRSSRKLERALHEDVGFRMLSGNQQPDYWTLSEFRRRHLAALRGLFLQTVKLAQRAEMVKLGQVAIDGTKLKANASKHKAMSYARMEKEEKRLREEIRRYFEEVETTDRAEDERYGAKRGDELPDHLKTEKERLDVIRNAMAQLEEEARRKAAAEQQKRRDKADKDGRTYRPRKDANDAVPSPKAQRNFTDPDSRIMKNADKAFIQAYNAQAAVDADSQIIVAALLSNQAADGPHLVEMVEQVEQATGKRPGEVLADAGYFSEDNVTTLRERGMSVLIPPERVRHREWRERCTPPPSPPPKGASVSEWMIYRLKSPENRERYRKREQSVEPVFGQIKQARGLRQFLMRGLDKVSALWQLECAAHNLLKLYRAKAILEPTG